ncbi:hypothetical protein L0156_28415 [bacterium]|nr:hypothetical protein [bacterium]
MNLLESIEAWISNEQPENLIMLADRFLIRTILKHEEMNQLMAYCPELVEAFARADTELVLVNDPASCLVLLWCMQENGVDVQEALPGMQRMLDFCEPLIRMTGEPMRSVIRYWQVRTGFRSEFVPGPLPHHELLRIYHLLHVIFFLGNYGASRVPRGITIDDVMAEAHFLAQRHRSNADVIAELLLAEAILSPHDPATIDLLTQKLLTLSDADGKIHVPGGNAQTDHHAGCVASLALHLLNPRAS